MRQWLGARAARVTGRRIALAGGCIALGGVLGPPLAGAGVDTVKDVVVRNGIGDPVLTKAVGTDGVEVRNATDKPVPTQAVGTAEVRGTVTVANPTTAVTVKGTEQPLRVVPEEDVVTDRYQVTGMAVSRGGDNYEQTFPIPAGKALLVEHASCVADSISGTARLTHAQLAAYGRSGGPEHMPVAMPVHGGTSAEASPGFLAYRDHTGGMSIQANMDVGTGGAAIRCTVIGRTVTL